MFLYILITYVHVLRFESRYEGTSPVLNFCKLFHPPRGNKKCSPNREKYEESETRVKCFIYFIIMMTGISTV
jgi:hypothetical protein